jgi:hypothetical protein
MKYSNWLHSYLSGHSRNPQLIFRTKWNREYKINFVNILSSRPSASHPTAGKQRGSIRTGTAVLLCASRHIT